MQHSNYGLAKIINLMPSEINNIKQKKKRVVKENHYFIMIASKLVYTYK